MLSLLLGVPAGYALARARARTRSGSPISSSRSARCRPVATLIPFYLLMRDIGLLGTWWAVILINTVLNTAFVIWMMFSYFRAAPAEIEEAALTDGCTRVRRLPAGRAADRGSGHHRQRAVLHHVLLERLPLRELPHPADTKPISVALLAAYGTKDISWGTLGALAHFSTMPIVLLVLALNRYFVQGLTKGVH